MEVGQNNGLASVAIPFHRFAILCVAEGEICSSSGTTDGAGELMPIAAVVPLGLDRYAA